MFILELNQENKQLKAKIQKNQRDIAARDSMIQQMDTTIEQKVAAIIEYAVHDVTQQATIKNLEK